MLNVVKYIKYVQQQSNIKLIEKDSDILDQIS